MQSLLRRNKLGTIWKLWYFYLHSFFILGLIPVSQILLLASSSTSIAKTKKILKKLLHVI